MKIEDFKLLFSKVHGEIMQEKKTVRSMVMYAYHPFVIIEHDESLLSCDIKKWFCDNHNIPYDETLIIAEPIIIKCNL